MKKNILIKTIVFATAILGFAACKKDNSLKSDVATTDGMSYLRIIDASPNFRKIFNLPDSFNVYINGNKITGFTPAATYLMAYGAIFPTISTNNGYVAIPPGTVPIKLTVAGVITPDSIPIITLTKTFLPNKMYTLMITDSIGSTRDSSQIFVQDNYVQPTSTYYNLRFIHAVFNDTLGKTIDIWSTRTNRTILSNAKPGTITSFTQFPYNSVYADTFFVRRSGVTTYNLDTLAVPVNTLYNQRSYTLYYKGDANSNANSNPKRRHLATYIHQ